MTDIKLIDIMKIGDPKNYKLHLGCKNKEGKHPLDLYIQDKKLWANWNEWKKENRNDWTQPYIFSLIEFYPTANAWLFGGIFSVLERKKKEYKIKEVPKYEKFDGRLILFFKRHRGMRGRAFLLKRYIDELLVNQILETEYTGEVYPGHDKINHDFSALKRIVAIEKSDWKTALSSIKGIYLIFDKKNGKGYVGSAYGDVGIWSRLACYLGTGHGWNDQLVKLIKEKGKDYADANFKFTVLEIHGMDTPNKTIIDRETYWKEKLGTRTHGYNSN